MANKIQAVLLCAGPGNRLRPLTDNLPKCLVKIYGKSLIEYKLEILKGLVDEIIIVVGYLGDKVIEEVGNNYKGISIKYIWQKEMLGTGHALIQTSHLLENKFIVLNGDDVYSREDIQNALKFQFAILGKSVPNPSDFGILEVAHDQLLSIVEKPINPPSNLANIGCYVFDKSIFEFELEKSQRGEYEIIDYLTYLIDKGEKVNVVEVKGYWIPVNNFDEFERANEVLGKER